MRLPTRAIACSLFCAQLAAGCASSPSASRSPQAVPSPSSTAATADSSRTSAQRVAGSLRQDEISLRLPLGGVLARVMPLDDRIIRLLAPDSYRNLVELLQGQQSRLVRARATTGQEKFSIWYATFVGLEPDARFNPGELVITTAGRDFRALEIIPLTAGFGEQRIQQGQSQAALYLYDDAVDPEQPVEISMEGVRNGDWASILRMIERERSRIGSVRTDTTTGSR